jgi:hypothetical protein
LWQALLYVQCARGAERLPPPLLPPPLLPPPLLPLLLYLGM